MLGSGAFWFWRAPAQLAMLWSSSLACLAILAVVRAQALEPLFGGLDHAVRLHRRLGLAALLLLIVHVLLLALGEATKTGAFLHILVPFWSDEARSIDILVFYVLIALGVLENPLTRQRVPNLPHAQSVIDDLMMLRDKTRGNLEPDEEEQLTTVIGELQRHYVTLAQERGTG